MRKRIALLITGMTLNPVLTEAAACRLEQATFRPRFASQAYILTTVRGDDELLLARAISPIAEARAAALWSRAIA